VSDASVQVEGSPLSWSPDGKRLLFTAAPGGLHPITVLSRSATGWTAEPLPTHPRPLEDTHRDHSARWSNDGQHVAFLRARWVGDGMDTTTGEVWVARADGSGVRQLLPGPDHGHVCWTPDDRSIAASGSGSVLIVPVDGSAAPTQLRPQAARAASHCSWQRLAGT
jgi:Tol biopolymer transport system component